MDTNVLPPTSPHPPASLDVIDALKRTTTGQDALIVLHLVTPLDVVIPVNADLYRGSWRLRDMVAPRSGDLLADVYALTQSAHIEGMSYFDLRAVRTVTQLVKVRRSGTRLVAFGADLLVGGPQVVAEPDVPPTALQEVLDRWMDDPSVGQAGVVALPSGTFLIEGDESYLLLRQA